MASPSSRYATPVALALVLSTTWFAILALRAALAAWLAFPPDEPDPPRPPAATIERVLALTPGNAVYRSWSAQRHHEVMRASWLDTEAALSHGRVAIAEATAAIERLQMNGHLHVVRARIAADLARVRGLAAEERAALHALGGADARAAVALRPNAPNHLANAATVAVAHWPGLDDDTRAWTLGTLRAASRVERLGNPDRIRALWTAVRAAGPSLAEAIETMERANHPDSSRAQRQLAAFWAERARSPWYGNADSTEVHGAFVAAERAAAERAQRAVEGERR